MKRGKAKKVGGARQQTRRPRRPTAAADASAASSASGPQGPSTPTRKPPPAPPPPMLVAYVYVAGYAKAEGETQAMTEGRKRLEAEHIRVVFREANEGSQRDDPRQPYVYITVGDSWRDFPALGNLAVQERCRWLNFKDLSSLIPDFHFNCWFSATDPLPKERLAAVRPLLDGHRNVFTSGSPLVSVFTAAFRSGDKIKCPHRSLLQQTYHNWEWIIVDDSGDDGVTYRDVLLPLASGDGRIRVFSQDRRSGYIGDVKRRAAGLCAGEILVEVDHDDDLTPDCLQRLLDGFKRHPECGFAYADSCEVFAHNKHAHWYGWDFGYKFGMCYRVWVKVIDRWANALRTPSLNWKTIRHLVGLANHPRAWTRDCYHLVGGHRPELSVADDYDLIVRTFLCTKFLRIPHMTYVQYRNAGGDNQTFQRNAEIQVLCAKLERHYRTRIDARLTELGMPTIEAGQCVRIWTTAEGDYRRQEAEITDYDPDVDTTVFPIADDPSTIKEAIAALADAMKTQHARGWRHAEYIIVGQVPGFVEGFAKQATPGSIRWWQMEPKCGLEECLGYALMLRGGSGRLSIRVPPSPTGGALAICPPIGTTDGTKEDGETEHRSVRMEECDGVVGPCRT